LPRQNEVQISRKWGEKNSGSGQVWGVKIWGENYKTRVKVIKRQVKVKKREIGNNRPIIAGRRRSVKRE
jgi:hypothetical protein